MIDIIMPKNLYHIVYDIDDVLADFWGTVLPMMNAGFEIDLKKEDIVSYNGFTEKYGITTDEFLGFVTRNYLLQELKPTPILSLMNAQYSFGHKISVVTSRDYLGLKTANVVTKRWLERNGARYHDLHISGKNKKSSFFEKGSVDIVYDDHSDNIDDYINSGVLNGYGVIVDQPWNRHYSRSGVIRKIVKSDGVFDYE